MAAVAFRNVTKVFPDGTRALNRLTLEAADGELLALVGPSGSGKTTALRVLAGLDQPTSGEVFIGDQRMTGVPPHRRNLAVVLESDGLYPAMTVEGNLRFPLEVRRVGAAVTHARVERERRRFRLSKLMRSTPAELSAGQRQAVATGRALVRDAAALLLDEPMSRVDPHRRMEVRRGIADLQRATGLTTLLVTHDPSEAMALGTRIAVLHAGALLQVGSPADVYHRPRTTLVAGFFGSPPMNLAPAALDQVGEVLRVRVGPLDVALPDEAGIAAVRAHAGRAVIIGIRPEHLRRARRGDDFGECFTVRAQRVHDQGPRRFLRFELVGAPWLARIETQEPVAVDYDVEVHLDPERLVVFDAVTSEAIWLGSDA